MALLQGLSHNGPRSAGFYDGHVLQCAWHLQPTVREWCSLSDAVSPDIGCLCQLDDDLQLDGLLDGGEHNGRSTLHQLHLMRGSVTVTTDRAAHHHHPSPGPTVPIDRGVPKNPLQDYVLAVAQLRVQWGTAAAALHPLASFVMIYLLFCVK